MGSNKSLSHYRFIIAISSSGFDNVIVIAVDRQCVPGTMRKPSVAHSNKQKPNKKALCEQVDEHCFIALTLCAKIMAIDESKI